MRKVTLVILTGVLATGCSVTVPGKPMPDAFRDLRQPISDSELKDAGFAKKSDRWVAGNLHVVLHDGKIVQIGNEAEGLICDFDKFDRAHLSLVSATAVFRTALESKTSFPLNKQSREWAITLEETNEAVMTASCLRTKR